MKNKTIVSLIGLILLFSTLAIATEQVRVGLGSVIITPPIGSPMAGYGSRKGVVESVHDPLLSKVMVLESSEKRIAIITFDLRRLASKRLITEIKALGFDHVLLTSSHTHSGPNADLSDFPSPKKSWRKEMEDKVIAMVKEAQNNLFPASIGIARGGIHLGFNRRLVDENGKVTMFWRNEERRPTHPVDPTLTTIRIEDANGKTKAILVHYACHPVVLGPDNLAISADYPGAMRRAINAELGEEVETFFLQGAAGDINPFQDKQPIDQRGFEVMEQVGQELAAAALKLNAQLDGKMKAIQQLQIVEKDMEFDHRWNKGEKVGISLSTLLINGELGIIGFPGEVFVEFQINLRDRSPIQHTLLMGYTMSGMSDWPDYIPTRQAAVEGGYGAHARTHIEVGAGETIIDQAIISLYKLQGKLTFDKNGY